VRTKQIKGFINRVINPSTLNGEGKKSYDKLNSNIDVITKNIKFLVTYAEI